MSIQHTTRTGQTYHLHEKTTSSGKTAYFFSGDAEGQLAAAMPEGYEIYENVNGQVFLRKKTPQVILPSEVSLVENALRKHGEAWQFRVEVKKSAIVVYQANDMSGIDRLATEFGRRPLSSGEKTKHANYMAMLRFSLIEKKSRAFITERFCFRGSIDDWIHIGGPGNLAPQVQRFVKHLGQESFYELM